MAFASAEGGGYGADASVIHFDPAHADHIQVPDAELLFRGEYQRLGPDLVLTGPDGRHHIIPGYFSSEQHPPLVAPNGASLAADLVDLLAGSPTPGQYAQAQPTTPPDAIGKCEKVVGSVTVVRNGVAVALHVGDAVFKSDVVQTGANSSVGIGFPDGTALNLVANTRMALNDYSFDASSTSNSALFTLVEGTFAFVAGKVAHDGNMKVATPVATMGIRGTTVYFATVTSSLGEVQYLAQLFADYKTAHVGVVEWYDNNPASPTYGQVIDTIADTSSAHYFTPRLGQAPGINVQPATAAQLQNDIINDLFRVVQLINATRRRRRVPAARHCRTSMSRMCSSRPKAIPDRSRSISRSRGSLFRPSLRYSSSRPRRRSSRRHCRRPTRNRTQRRLRRRRARSYGPPPRAATGTRGRIGRAAASQRG
jgi:FecR protein